ncbi:MAG: adenosine-specific kinase [Thermoplasmatales archaeon]|nr:adenosine-specific kinase [Thermoplasmatales archaeon]
MELKTVKIEKPGDINIVIGQSHFIKTVEDIYEAMVTSSPNIKFGVGFCESSGPCLVRTEGNDDELKNLAGKNALSLSCGHTFIIMMKNAFPVNVLNTVKNISEVCSIYCATANDAEVIVAETEKGRGILGVVDGEKSKGIESENDVKERKAFLRRIGYKR